MAHNSFAKSAQSYGEALEARGFRRLGGGMYSACYGKPGSDRVIKISESDMAWLSYMAWVMVNPNRQRYAPCLYSIKYHKDFYVAVMDRVHIIAHDDSGFADEMDSVIFNPRDREACNTVNANYGSDAAEFIADLKDSFNFTDLHRGNYGLRNGVLCVFDPTTCHQNETDSTALHRRYKTPTSPQYSFKFTPIGKFKSNFVQAAA